MPSAEEIERFKGRETTWDNTDSTGGLLRYDADGGGPPLLPATVSAHDLRIRQKLLDMESINAAVAGPVPADWDAWRQMFTARVDALGYVVNYVDDGSIKVYQGPNLYVILRDYRSSMGWLLREETERRDAETARRLAEADAIRSRAEAGELSNLATHAHVLEQILARLDKLEERQ